VDGKIYGTVFDIVSQVYSGSRRDSTSKKLSMFVFEKRALQGRNYTDDFKSEVARISVNFFSDT
jgi:hypothetical protein